MPRTDEGFFSGRDDTRLYWQATMPDGEPTAFVGIVHGYGDHSARYRRFAEHLAGQNFSVLAFDYRGHGKADGRRGYCERWGDYLKDLEVFWARLRGQAGGKPVFLFAHSHGGLMALHWLLTGVQGLKGLVLSSPYLKLALDPPAMKVISAKVAGLVIPFLPVPTGIEYSQLSRDPAWQQETKDDPLYGTKATPRWFVQSTQAQEAILKSGAQVTVPLLMCTGGDDPIASTPTSKQFFETIASGDKRYIEYPQMKHEIVCELEKEKVWADISNWIKNHL
ncbi:MAG: alpha/beta hydrolase [Myxococcaceae bacterium]